MSFHFLACPVFRRVGVLVAALLVSVTTAQAALGEAPCIAFAPGEGALPLVEQRTATALLVDRGDWPGVQRAAHDLQADVERVTGIRPAVEERAPARAPALVVIGTLGHSALIDDLARRGKIDVGAIRGKWECFVHQVVSDPLPGVAQALVIAGSDKRGTIYGIYDLSEQIGVSPWYWWADVTPAHRDALFVLPVKFFSFEPSVKYRGIFLNDEAPDLTNWVHAKFGAVPTGENPPRPAGVANYNHEFYARIFEVLLRLRGNYLWPAMWNNAFNEDDPDNARLADEYGVVMGNSHQEPMLRAQKEWDRRYLRTLGTWNYAEHPDVMENFWREGIRRNRSYESIVTMGLRGANDTPMAPGGPAANRALLEKIVDVQRKILAGEINPDVTKVPQLWCLYKEVQDFYEAGMRVPDDITLLWAEDNWGNLRRVPTPEERKRPGGAGIYYHFDYHGGPRSYQWLNSNPLPKIRDQMTLAKQYGADRIWIVNVGHFKGYELPTEYFLHLAWDTPHWGGESTDAFAQLWAAREFGAENAGTIAHLVSLYAKYNGRRKPEQLAPDTWSLVNYHEAERVIADYDALAALAEKTGASLPAAKHDAFYELVQFPIKASALLNRLYVAAGRNALYAKQGRASAGDYSAETRRLFASYLALMDDFNTTFAGGRWEHFMDQPVLGYTTWRDPPKNNLDHLKLVTPPVPEPAALGVSVEGAEDAWPGGATEAQLPTFDTLGRQTYYFEVFNRGKTAFGFTATADAPWILLDGANGVDGQLGTDRRVQVSIAWDQLPSGFSHGAIHVSGAGRDVVIKVEAYHLPGISRAALHSFAEEGGVVAVEPEHFTRNRPGPAASWKKIEDYGRTLSGMRAEGPTNITTTPGEDAPCLEYEMYINMTGHVPVRLITGPVLNFLAGRDVRYAIAFDNEPPQVVTLVPKTFRPGVSAEWETAVGNNAHTSISHHTISRPGYHTLKIWMVDPAVVLQRIIVEAGGLRPSYLGPPESLRGEAKP